MYQKCNKSKCKFIWCFAVVCTKILINYIKRQRISNINRKCICRNSSFLLVTMKVLVWLCLFTILYLKSLNAAVSGPPKIRIKRLKNCCFSTSATYGLR